MSCLRVRRPAGFAALLMLMGIALASAPPPTFAGSGGKILSPPPGEKVVNGLKLEVDAHWVDGSGYRPVRVRFVTWPLNTPSPADRTLEVRLMPKYYGMGGLSMATKTVVLPEGATSAEMVIPIPQNGPATGMQIAVSEDGRTLKDLSYAADNALRADWDWSEAYPAILFIHRDAPRPADRKTTSLNQLPPNWPELRQLANVLPGSEYYDAYISELASAAGTSGAASAVTAPNPPAATSNNPTSAAVSTLDLVEALPQWELASLSALPTNWIEYTCLDLVFIPFDDLELLSSNHPDAFAALQKWASTGPTLCVYNLGDDFERLEKLEALLGLTPASLPSEGSRTGWKAPNPGRFGQRVQLHDTYSGYLGPAAGSAGRTPPDPPEVAPFLLRELGLGHVVAFRSSNPLQDEHITQWFLNSLPNNRLQWYRRNGLSMLRENADFWKFLIPGIGKAPVVQYLLLISAFVIVLGPVNYFALQRLGRLYLLVITVPAGASLVTLALFAYAAFGDGFSVRSRIRSYSHLDQTRGTLISWSWQAYYAGLAPSEGLSYPLDAAVYPLEHYPRQWNSNQGNPRHIIWGEEQNLASGHLTSRATTQFVVVQPTQTSARLEINPVTQGATPRLEVTNRLGADVVLLVVRDAQGRDYLGESMAVDRTQVLETTDQAIAKLSEVYHRHRPSYPPDFNPDFDRDSLLGTTFFWRSRYDSSWSAVTMSSGVLEQNMARLREELAPGTYVAVLNHNPHVPLGFERPREIDSLHVIHGQWTEPARTESGKR